MPSRVVEGQTRLPRPSTLPHGWASQPQHPISYGTSIGCGFATRGFQCSVIVLLHNHGRFTTGAVLTRGRMSTCSISGNSGSPSGGSPPCPRRGNGHRPRRSAGAGSANRPSRRSACRRPPFRSVGCGRKGVALRATTAGSPRGRRWPDRPDRCRPVAGHGRETPRNVWLLALIR